MRTHDATVLEQFDSQARAYLTSAVHSAGTDLERAKRLVEAALPPRAAIVDVGCGAGHLAFALAPHVARVAAVDPSPAMRATVEAAARERGLANVATYAANAAALPFAVGTFCVAASRYSAHHWRDVPAALREMRRVLKPGGFLLMIDALGDESPLVDTHLQALELLRDPSHVRDLAAPEWRTALERAGFAIVEESVWPTRIEFAAWIERMRTPPESVAAIRRLESGAPREVSEALALEPDGSFTLRTGLFWARGS
ncbi:MAG TPA: class I SAM-dependent methyltransferase [Gammaproteobacteria bacterium]|nr:class I SAM-dependent methyltransferase [Gammaproteobacteria bacterium]